MEHPQIGPSRFSKPSRIMYNRSAAFGLTIPFASSGEPVSHVDHSTSFVSRTGDGS